MPLTGDKAFLARLKRARNVDAALTDWAVDSATEVMEEARFLIRDGATPPPHHVPSAPGTPANEEYGDLARDMTVEALPEPGSAAFIAYSDHALFTEFGTKKMAERPWARPASANKRPKLLKNAVIAINRTTK